jgi:hypothetical protein
MCVVSRCVTQRKVDWCLGLLYWIVSLSTIFTLEKGDGLFLLPLWNFTFRKVIIPSGFKRVSCHSQSFLKITSIHGTTRLSLFQNLMLL